MVSLVSIGIGHYSDKTIPEISCAKIDIEKVYSTFKQTLGSSFSDFSSVCLLDVRRDNFLSLLAGLSTALSSDDITIIYFSCHATYDNEELNLVFSDEDGSSNGLLSVSQLKSILTKHKCDYVLIFDCCYSESALVMANKLTASNKNNISVIASSQYYSRAKFDSAGSAFTRALCDSIWRVFDKEQDISINNIVAEIKHVGINCYVNLSEGKADLLLKKAYDTFVNFPRIFLSKLNCSNRFVREMMWYSLNDVPSKESLEIIDDFIIDSAKTCEADWLVRRAIGSMLSNIKGNDYRIYETVLKLLHSNNWMLQTIGLIASRNSVDNEIARIQCEIITNQENNMSLVWLADLYLSDSQYASIHISLDSNLAKTDWGLIQIWDRYWKSNNTTELVKIMENKGCDKDALSQLKMELYLRGVYTDGSCDQALLSRMKQSSLITILYNSTSRGRTTDKGKKWLLSMMYGNWRGQLSINFDEYFCNTKYSKIIEDLSLIRLIPSPEKKAALFSFFQYSAITFEKYKSYLTWGLTDPHPWVRREAVLAYKHDLEAVKLAFSDTIDRRLYIGTFDLIISASRFLCKDFLRRYINQYVLTECEYNSLLQSIFNE